MKNLIESILVNVMNTIEQYNNRDKNPSLLAHNIAWFTNCSWAEQIAAFKQIDLYR